MTLAYYIATINISQQRLAPKWWVMQSRHGLRDPLYCSPLDCKRTKCLLYVWESDVEGFSTEAVLLFVNVWRPTSAGRDESDPSAVRWKEAVFVGRSKTASRLSEPSPFSFAPPEAEDMIETARK